MVVNSLGATLAALADPTRRSILRRLAAGPADVNALARPYRMSQQAVSKHLAILERARLVDKRREGRRRVCRLRPAPLKELDGWIAGWRRFWEESFERLDDVLRDLQRKEKPHGRP